MDEVDDLYGDLLAFDDDLLPLETPKAGDDGKKKKKSEGTDGGGDVEPSPVAKDPSSEQGVPPGLSQPAQKPVREGFQKVVFDPKPLKSTSSRPKGDVMPPLLESKPSEVAERAAIPVDSTKQSPKNIRYFILKSNNLTNLRRSVENAVWATQPHNEGKLNEAYHMADEVHLIFSVNQSGHFQGFARMSSPIGRGPKHGFWVGSSWGGLFQVEWEVLHNLAFHKVEHLANPLNEGKPVKIAKDGQEVPVDVAKELIRLMAEGSRAEGAQKPEPQHRLFIEPAPYFGPTRATMERQSYMRRNAGQLSEGFMGSSGGNERFAQGNSGPNSWGGRFQERGSSGLESFSKMPPPMEMMSGLTRSGPSSREQQEFDIPSRGPPPSRSGSEWRFSAPQMEARNSRSPVKNHEMEAGVRPIDTSPAGEVLRLPPKESNVTPPPESRLPPGQPSSERPSLGKSPVQPLKAPMGGMNEGTPDGKVNRRPDGMVPNGNESDRSRKRERSMGRPEGRSLSGSPPRKQQKRKQHLFDLTYEEYLDQYYKFQDRVRELLASGAIWKILGMGDGGGNDGEGPWAPVSHRGNGGNGNGNASSGPGGGSGVNFGGVFGERMGNNGGGGGNFGARCWINDKVGSSGSVNKPMVESEYVEYCKRFCGFHGFSFNEAKVRDYYHRMRVQFEATRARGQNSHRAF